MPATALRINKPALRLAAKVLRELTTNDTDKKFNMSNLLERFPIIDNTRVVGCGTVGCAMGYLSLDPRMNALGLKNKVPKDSVAINAYVHELLWREQRAKNDNNLSILVDPVAAAEDTMVNGKVTYRDPKTGEKFNESFDACEALFRLSSEQSGFLFTAAGYKPKLPGNITPQDVADQIEYLIAHDGKLPRKFLTA